MGSREKPLDREMVAFVKAHLGRNAFAPFTGADHAAWKAWCHLLRLYGVTGDVYAIVALRATIECAQRKACVWAVFVQAIPGVLDWSTVRELWPRIVDGIPPTLWPRDLTSSSQDDYVYRKAALFQMHALERGSGGAAVRRHGLGWS